VPFYVHKCIDKLWGRIWGHRDQNRGFGVENSAFPRGKHQKQGDCSGATRSSATPFW